MVFALLHNRIVVLCFGPILLYEGRSNEKVTNVGSVEHRRIECQSSYRLMELRTSE